MFSYWKEIVVISYHSIIEWWPIPTILFFVFTILIEKYQKKESWKSVKEWIRSGFLAFCIILIVTLFFYAPYVHYKTLEDKFNEQSATLKNLQDLEMTTIIKPTEEVFTQRENNKWFFRMVYKNFGPFPADSLNAKLDLYFDNNIPLVSPEGQNIWQKVAVTEEKIILVQIDDDIHTKIIKGDKTLKYIFTVKYRFKNGTEKCLERIGDYDANYMVFRTLSERHC